MANDIDRRIGIYPGTFDPLTFGHVDIISRAATFFDKLIIGVAIDNRKTTLFSIEERKSLVQQEIAAIGINNVLVMSFSGLLIKFAIKCRAGVIVRGLRALSDFEYEFQMAYMNRTLNENMLDSEEDDNAQCVETIFLPATAKSHFISSSFVRQVALLGGDLRGFVSDQVAAALKRKFCS